MAKARIYDDERYPVYGLYSFPGQPGEDLCEVPDELIERYEAAEKEWEEMQGELGRILRETIEARNAAAFIASRAKVEPPTVGNSPNYPQYTEWANEDARGE